MFFWEFLARCCYLIPVSVYIILQFNTTGDAVSPYRLGMKCTETPSIKRGNKLVILRSALRIPPNLKIDVSWKLELNASNTTINQAREGWSIEWFRYTVCIIYEQYALNKSIQYIWYNIMGISKSFFR